MIRNLKRVPALFLFICGLMVWALPATAEDRMAKDGDTVSIHYTGSLEDKTVFDTSENRDPLEFTVGDKNLIPGMNNAVRGMKVGESKTVSIPPEEAYGPYSDKLLFEVPTKNLPPGITAGFMPSEAKCLSIFLFLEKRSHLWKPYAASHAA